MTAVAVVRFTGIPSGPADGPPSHQIQPPPLGVIHLSKVLHQRSGGDHAIQNSAGKRHKHEVSFRRVSKATSFPPSASAATRTASQLEFTGRRYLVSSTIASANFRPRGTRQDTVVGKRSQRAVGCPTLNPRSKRHRMDPMTESPFPEISAAVLSSTENIAWMTHSWGQLRECHPRCHRRLQSCSHR